MIERTLVSRGWLDYVYYAKAPKEVIQELLNRLDSTIKAMEREVQMNLKG